MVENKTVLKYEIINREVTKISFDLLNPRGETEEQIKKDPEFNKLKDSIREFGVLVPLVIKKNDDDTYILIDGERRLRAAQDINIDKVPTILAKDTSNGKIIAYHIHMLHKDWGKAAETKSIKNIVDDLKKENSKITDQELKKKLKDITQHKNHEIDDLLKLIKYDDKTIIKAINKELNISYLIQIESNFMKPLIKKYPEIIKKYGEEKIRNIMIKKAENGLLGNTRFLMDNFKHVFKNRKTITINKIIIDFLNDDKKNIESTYKSFSSINGTKIKPTKSIKKPKTINVKTVNYKTFQNKKIKIRKNQQLLLENIRPKFESIYTMLNDVEKEYIKEAIFCLESHCFKAATLMIWCTGIDKILMFINKDIKDYNKKSLEMKNNPKSVYRHFAKNFQISAKDIIDIRQASNDIQLLCYLYYIDIITETECKKLKNHFDTRCDCAHPTDIILKPNDVISIFDDIYEYILTNSNLK